MIDIELWLLRARGINAKIDALDELIERTKSRAEGGGEKGGGGVSRKPGGLEKILCQIEAYENERDRMEGIRDEVYNAICLLDDNLQQSALISYYITGRDWEDIAIEMNKDRTTIYRWHKRAKQELKKIFSENCNMMQHDAT